MLRALADDAKEVRVEARSQLSHPRPATVDEVIDAHPANGCSASILFMMWSIEGGGDLKLTRPPDPEPGT
jgi:hypothetical protein